MTTVTKWEVQIEGDPADLEYLAIHCKSPPLVIARKDDGTYRLYHRDFDAFATTNNAAVFDYARKVLIRLSGALQYSSGRASALKVGHAYAISPDGVLHRIMQIEGCAIELKGGWMSATIGTTDGSAPPAPVPPKAVRLFNLSETDEAVAKVMRLIDNGDKSSWGGLFRIYEVIKADAGGVGKLISEQDERLFKHSANSVAVGGDSSRHGAESKRPPANPMSLGEAKAFINCLLDAWFRSKGIS